MAYKKSTSLSPGLNYRYAQILMGLNKNQEAYDKLEEVVKAGKATPEMAADFKKLYVKVKGNESGFDAYAAAIRKAYLENLSKQLTKDMVKEPAAGFTLTDLNGKQVSLADYKGKIVILDFWATWCGPCKASFPAMQMAVNKYKDDENVKFLFIHTWEKVADPVKDASDYIKSMKYSFEVLMDVKDADTKVNKVVSSYKVNGIPAKFVIDAAGNVRFKLTGFDGSNEAAVDELSMMIDMAKAKS
ncbi:Thiol-disulfide oxidoreductase ResA [compost metagenome]